MLNTSTTFEVLQPTERKDGLAAREDPQFGGVTSKLQDSTNLPYVSVKTRIVAAEEASVVGRAASNESELVISAKRRVEGGADTRQWTQLMLILRLSRSI